MQTNAHKLDPAEDATGDVHVVGGRYRIRRVIGRGGMGVVYEAENSWTHRRVALKVLDPERSHEPLRVERFMREARAASALHHPNVVDVLDMGQDPADGALYIVQELLVGEDLRERLVREGRLDEARALAVLIPVLRGLSAAHAAGIVHRDVKPANVFLARGADGREVPKIIDFGIARDVARDVARTHTGETVGTPAYMAPEQLRAERDLTPAADVWALGVTLYEMLSGEKPFAADNYNVLVHRVLSGERAPTAAALPHVSSALRAVLDRALSPDAASRFPDAAAMLAALEAPAAVAPSPVAPSPVAPPPVASRARALGLAASALLVASALVAWTLHVRAPAAPPAPPARPAALAPPATAPASPATAPASPLAEPAPLAPAEPARARPDRLHARPHVERTVLTAPVAAPDASLGRPRARLLSPGGSYPSP